MNITDKTKCVVEMNGLSVWAFESENRTIAEILISAENQREKDIELYKSHIKNYPNQKDMWNKRLEETKAAKYEVLTFEEFSKLEEEKYLSGELHEITRDDWDENLNVLPPMSWCTIDGVTMFCMSEFTSGPYTTQYAKYNDKYYCKTVNAYDKSTWINNILT